MKGFVFTEFLEMVEDKFGYDVADEIVEEDKLPSKGIYTSIGTYSHEEMVSLVVNLSHKTDIAVPDLLHAYGKYLFNVFSKNYSVFFKDVTCAFDFLERIDNYIHIEVKKLYPDAELPSFEITRNGNEMAMLYKSSRKMSDLAVGLIEACMEYYGEKGNIVREYVDDSGEIVNIKVITL